MTSSPQQPEKPQQDDAQEQAMNQDVAPQSDENAPSEEQAGLPVPAGPMDRYVENFQKVVERASVRMDAIAEYIAPRNNDDDQAPENIGRTSIVFGMFMVILVFGIFGLWSTLAPIDSAAIAQGHVVLDSNKKVIDHLEGGIVEEILVKEGSIVKAGDVLVRLDDTAARARLDLYRGQFISEQATEARLLAERDNADEVSFPQSLLELEDSDVNVAANLDSQRRLFKSRRESMEGRDDVLKQKVKQHDEEINGLREQIKSANKQLSLLNEEIDDVRYLLKSGNAAKTRLLALERRRAEIQGQKGEQTSTISRVEQSINETKIEMYNLKTDFLNEVVEKLKQTQSRLSDLQEQLRAAQDVVRRIEIKAPIGGEVTGLAVHTEGGVIAPNEPVMSIVPSDDLLIVEARVAPQDIDVVRPGLIARVRLSAYKVRSVPPVEGVVDIVSADRFEDERTGQSYFNARIVIDEEQLAKLEDVTLSPGMPAEVLIVTGSRSLFSYLMDPISSSFNRSFREQ